MLRIKLGNWIALVPVAILAGGAAAWSEIMYGVDTGIVRTVGVLALLACGLLAVANAIRRRKT